MIEKARPHCGSCKWWWIPDLRDDGTQPESQCVVHAPAAQPWSFAQPVVHSALPNGLVGTNDPLWRWSVWPPTPFNAYCGKWEERPSDWPKPDEWLAEVLRRENERLSKELQDAQAELRLIKASMMEAANGDTTEANPPDGQATAGSIGAERSDDGDGESSG